MTCFEFLLTGFIVPLFIHMFCFSIQTFQQIMSESIENIQNIEKKFVIYY